jgi:colicin import membrane protein
VDGYLKLLRFPLDAAVGVGLRNRAADRSTATIRLDRAEAGLRGLAGRTLGDEELRRDAELRRAAADERERAVRLRVTAQRRTELADERLSETEDKAERRRRQAAARAAERKARAERRQRAETGRVREVEAQRRRANGKAAAQQAAALEERSKHVRLEQLDEEADALKKQKEALAAKNEARRLRAAASKTKAARKKSMS